MCVMVLCRSQDILDLYTLFNLACHISIAGSTILDRDFVPAHCVSYRRIFAPCLASGGEA